MKKNDKIQLTLLLPNWGLRVLPPLTISFRHPKLTHNNDLSDIFTDISIKRRLRVQPYLEVSCLKTSRRGWLIGTSENSKLPFWKSYYLHGLDTYWYLRNIISSFQKPKSRWNSHTETFFFYFFNFQCCSMFDWKSPT